MSQPDKTHWQHELAQAYQALKSGDFRRAAAMAEAVLVRQPGNADALMAAGMACWHGGQAGQACEYFAQALRARPQDAAVRFWFLQAFKAHDPARARHWIEQQLDAGDLAYHQQPLALKMIIVETLEQSGLYRRVIDWLSSDKSEAVSDSQENQVLVWQSAVLAWNHEMVNQPIAAEKHARAALAREPGNFRANSVLARLALRQKKPETAMKYLAAIDSATLSPTNQAIMENLRAQAEEQRQQYPAAFAAYRRSNQWLAAKGGFATDDIDPYSMAWAEAIAALPWDETSPLASVEALEVSPPVFLLGFPRAGTTLLEKMLNAHPSLVSVEEKPTLNPVFRHFYAGQPDMATLSQRLQNHSAQVMEKLRLRYRQNRNQWLDGSANPGQLIVDKLPLNWMHLGVLAWLFPEARFILAIRDPRDVALSCYSQLFDPAGAMRHFLDWETTARYLHAVAQAGLAAMPLAGQRVFLHRYEDFVAAPEQQARRIMTFLGLPWQQSVMDFQREISGQAINTPSYQRVAQPIDRSRVARWRKFAFAFAPVRRWLDPLAMRLGYEGDD